MHRVARLEGNDPAPASIGENSAELSRSQTQALEVVVRGDLETFETAADIPRIAAFEEVSDPRVRFARAVENGFAFSFQVRLPDILDMEDGDHHAFAIPQGDFAISRREGFRESFRHVERDRHRPKDAARELHAAAHALVIGFVHEAGQRREATIEEHFGVADLPGGQVPRGEILRSAFGLSSLLGADNEVDELTAVRLDEMSLVLVRIQIDWSARFWSFLFRFKSGQIK